MSKSAKCCRSSQWPVHLQQLLKRTNHTATTYGTNSQIIRAGRLSKYCNYWQGPRKGNVVVACSCLLFGMLLCESREIFHRVLRDLAHCWLIATPNLRMYLQTLRDCLVCWETVNTLIMGNETIKSSSVKVLSLHQKTAAFVRWLSRLTEQKRLSLKRRYGSKRTPEQC